MIDRVTWAEYAAGNTNMEPTFEQERVQRRSLYHRMMDIWGEANHVKRAWERWSQEPNTGNKEALERHLEALHRACHYIYDDSTMRESMKYSLRIAEWELVDFCVWDNHFHNSKETATTWFDQWCYKRDKTMRTL